MDISTLANNSFKERLDEGCEKVTPKHKFTYKLGFIDGFEASFDWQYMDTAPKDDDILIATKDGLICIGCWREGKKLWYRQFGFGFIINPIAWTHLPVYKP